MPPVGVTLKLVDNPCCGVPRLGPELKPSVVAVGPLTLNVMKFVPVLPAVSVAWNDVVTEPVFVGVPLILEAYGPEGAVPLTTPVAEFSERPGGNGVLRAHA